MISLGIFSNFDLMAVGISVAGIGIFGFAVFFNNRHSVTNRAFLSFALLTVLWGISNYFNYQFSGKDWILWLLRSHLFISVWHAFTFFTLSYVFPFETVQFSRRYKMLLLGVLLVALVTLSPLALVKLTEMPQAGQAAQTERGPGMLLFALTAFSLIGAGLYNFGRKMRHASGVQRTQYKFILVGAFLTFLLILSFNLILPAIFRILRFIPMGAVAAFPFVVFAAYAIVRHHFLSVKVIATEILTFLLVVVAFSEVLISKDITEVIFRSGVFVGLLGFGILLIQSVFHEVEQREELQRLTKKLETANKELEELNKFKTGMLSLAAHQVKSPLGVIKQFATILIDGLYGPVNDKVKETLVKMRQRADDLVFLVNELIDVRKLEEGKMEYHFEQVKMADVVGESFENLKPLAAQKKLEFTLEVHSDAVVSIDVEKFKQVLQNLIDNSIKYTPSGFVHVELRDDEKDAKKVRFGVKDSGVGISDDLLPHLFEEFVRDEKVKKKILGTGLGLSIAKRIIEAHGGEAWAESKGEGKGAQFYVRLPRVKR